MRFVCICMLTIRSMHVPQRGSIFTSSGGVSMYLSMRAM